VGPRAGLVTDVRGKIYFLCRGSNLDHSVIQPVARHFNFIFFVKITYDIGPQLEVPVKSPI
jgi:hypothetical protein